ncbi:putative nrps-like enzyme protein [Botrytis fragariae]|uniref:Putative nrps-like enzyme protein n=1 Tax=Botrytis fragariae TaxID=1964551 RepID=A0A8H6AIP6_9HELO|nr:putative nrps-like enzyme protein [Botrytis fragariae]KAF5868107.1 putative nrps-like enzyme protein [Botrytis fragariae]
MAKHRPNSLYAEIPKSLSSYKDGFQKVTYANLANVINELAHWMYQTLGPGENLPTLAYIGINDIRYKVLILAAAKTGYKILLSSPRNSLAAHSNLFKILDCKIMITTNPALPMVPGIFDACGLCMIHIPSLEDLLEKTYGHFPYHKTFAQARAEPLAVYDGGLFASFLGALHNQRLVLHPLAGVPPSAQLVVDGLRYTKANCILLHRRSSKKSERIPSYLLNFLAKSVDCLMYAGDDVSQVAGDKISERVKFFMVIGSTESGVIPNIRPARQWPTKDWKYSHFNPHAGIDFRHQSDNQYEAVIIRDPVPEKRQPVFSVFPELDEWVPSQNSEKHSTVERAHAIERFWPKIEEANQECPQHAKVAKTHILFTAPEKPMERAGKGTIQRKPTLDLYSEELDKLYADAEKMSTSAPDEVDLTDSNSIALFIHNIIARLTGTNNFQDGDDLFAHGMMESLQALRLTRVLKQTFAIPDFDISTVYSNPSVNLLTDATVHLFSSHKINKSSSEESRQHTISQVLDEYKLRIDEFKNLTCSTTRKVQRSEQRVVALTGSIGSIGCYILQTLLHSESVSHVFCLNRTNLQFLQVGRSKGHSLETEFPTDRVTFLAADFSKKNLGLHLKIYNKLQESATDIIHNAWTINFNLPLSAFRSNIEGVINLASFAVSAAQIPSLMFVSSASSIAHFQRLPTTPESIIDDVSASLAMGYAESKYITKHLLDYTAKEYPALLLQIARIGQVAGPVSTCGSWNRQEWLPRLVLTSVQLDIMPESLDATKETEVDWIPLDILARVLVEFCLGDSDSSSTSGSDSGSGSVEDAGAKVFNPTNPVLASWKSLLSAINRSQDKALEPVPFNLWIEEVKREAEKLDDATKLEDQLADIPAVKVMPFYEGLAKGKGAPRLGNDRAMKMSKQLRELAGIKPEWMEEWVKS